MINCYKYSEHLAAWLNGNLKRIKDTKGEKILEMAAALGMTDRQLRGLARGGFTWTIEEFCKICAYLNVKPSSVIWEIEQKIEHGHPPSPRPDK